MNKIDAVAVILERRDGGWKCSRVMLSEAQQRVQCGLECRSLPRDYHIIAVGSDADDPEVLKAYCRYSTWCHERGWALYWGMEPSRIQPLVMALLSALALVGVLTLLAWLSRLIPM